MMQGKLIRRGTKLFVNWDDAANGVFNLSLPIHPNDLRKDYDFEPDDLSHLGLKDGDVVNFNHVTHCGILPYKDVAKICISVGGEPK